MINPFVIVIVVFAVFSIFVTAFVLIVERDLRRELSELCEDSFIWIEKLEEEVKELKVQFYKNKR